MALHFPFPSAVETPALILLRIPSKILSPFPISCLPSASARLNLGHSHRPRHGPVASVGKEETETRISSDEQQDASPEDLEYVRQIQRVLELLKKNRDMLFGEVKLTVMIEDPRDMERKRLLGIEDPDELTRDDLADALEDVCASVLCMKGEFQRIVLLFECLLRR